MAEISPPLRSPPSDAQRPRGMFCLTLHPFNRTNAPATGILKNPLTSPNGEDTPASPTEASTSQLNEDPISLNSDVHRPSLPRMTDSEQEITKANTLANAGMRRNSSNARSSMSRRQSHASQPDANDDNAMRLKWDEANIFLHEQDRGSTMKIDEPKTPFVRDHDLDAMDEDDHPATIDPNGLNVDELDKSKSSSRGRKTKGEDIPDLDLGEAEEAISDPALRRSDSTGRRVVVDEEIGADPVHEPESLSAEAKRKHEAFENKRKKHYEIPADVVLGYVPHFQKCPSAHVRCTDTNMSPQPRRHGPGR